MKLLSGPLAFGVAYLWPTIIETYIEEQAWYFRTPEGKALRIKVEDQSELFSSTSSTEEGSGIWYRSLAVICTDNIGFKHA